MVIDFNLNANELDLLSAKENQAIDKRTNLVQDYWNKCLQIIKDNVDSQAYNTWFAPLKALSYINNEFRIQLPSEWFREWLDSHYYNLINLTLKRIVGNDAELVYDVVVVDSNGAAPTTISYPSHKHLNISNDVLFNQRLAQSRLNPNYTFDNFIVGDSNRTSVNAARAVSKELDNSRFNPLFIYGGTGLGKTHLVQALGNNVLQNYPNKRVLYVSSDTFTSEFVAEITKKDNKPVNSFNETYRNVDLLIIDDIQFFAGKGATQDKFFHIFNSLLLEGKQIILTSDRPSNDLKKIDNRLASRFIAGLNVEIKMPDYKHRKDIIIHKSRIEGMNLSDGIIEYIAKNVTTNIREIQGTLINLSFRTTIGRKDLSLDLVSEVINKLASEKKPTTLEDIIQIVCTHYDIKLNLIESKTRKKEIAFARQMIMYLTRNHTKLSLSSIGDRFNRDHTTVIHACNSIEKYLTTNKKIKEEFDEIEAKIKEK